MFCHICGTELKDNTKFCTNCGTKIEEDEIEIEENKLDSRTKLSLPEREMAVDTGHMDEKERKKQSEEFYQKGDEVFEQGDYKEAFQWFRRAADLGNAVAMEAVGCSYLMGFGSEHNIQEGFIWLKKAADLGNDNAMLTIGRLYERGTLTDGKPYYRAAIDWYLQAACMGNAQAMYHVGQMCEKGQSVEKDDETAVVWYKRAAEFGNAEAIQELKKRENKNDNSVLSNSSNPLPDSSSNQAHVSHSEQDDSRNGVGCLIIIIMLLGWFLSIFL